MVKCVPQCSTEGDFPMVQLTQTYSVCELFMHGFGKDCIGRYIYIYMFKTFNITYHIMYIKIIDIFSLVHLCAWFIVSCCYIFSFWTLGTQGSRLLRVQSSFNDGNQTEPPRASKKCMFSASVGAVLSATCRLVVLQWHAFTRAIEHSFFQALRDECKRRI